MSNWYYYNDDDEKVGPISSTVLKELTRQGLVKRETKIENTNGRSALAGSINGLTFPDPTPPKPEVVQPVETEIYGFSSNPFEGFDFLYLTSQGQTPNDYDSFANTAPVVPQAQVQAITKKPITLVFIGLGCLFVLFILFCVLSISISVVNEKPRKVPKDFVFSLKTPPDDKSDLWFSLQGKKIKGKADIVLDESAAIEICDGCVGAAKHVYEIGSTFKDEDNLLQKMKHLQECCSFCMSSIIGILYYADKEKKTYPRLNITFRVVELGYDESGCFHNLEQMMASIKLSVSKLDSVKYENTHELLDLLSQYEEAVTKPENFITLERITGGFRTGSGYDPHSNYNIARKLFNNKFAETMSLAEKEWQGVNETKNIPR